MSYEIEQLHLFFKSLDRKTLDLSANVIVAKYLIHGIARELNFTPALAAELVGKMTIKVGNNTYFANQTAVLKLADEMVRVMGDLYDSMSETFDKNTGLAYLQSAAGEMSLEIGA